MIQFFRLAVAISVCIATTAVSQPDYDASVHPGWSAEQVERASSAQFQSLVERAQAAQQLGCLAHCERLDRVFKQLLISARTHSPRGETLPWSLTVVRLPELDAMAMPGGQVIISEQFVSSRLMTDANLAFVLAHEMAHSILEHERQTLSFARRMLPRQVERSVRDVYFEMDYNIALRKALEPVMQRGEYEADKLGLHLAVAAGFALDKVLDFARQECAMDAGAGSVVATHPPACLRLKALLDINPVISKASINRTHEMQKDN